MWPGKISSLCVLDAYLFLFSTGNPPLVIARGGFSGIFPDSSSAAYRLAMITSVPNVVSWCDVQLTKDGAGICAPQVKLDNCTDISDVFNKKRQTYIVNGVPTQGWFSIDFTLKDLANVACKDQFILKLYIPPSALYQLKLYIRFLSFKDVGCSICGSFSLLPPGGGGGVMYVDLLDTL